MKRECPTYQAPCLEARCRHGCMFARQVKPRAVATMRDPDQASAEELADLAHDLGADCGGDE